MRTNHIHSISTVTRKRAGRHTTCDSCENHNCLVKRNLAELADSPLADSKNSLQCKKGSQFIMEGAPVHGLYFVLRGKVKVFRTGIHGREQTVRFAKEGEIIGHRGFGTEEFYSIGALALEDTHLCYFSKDTLQNALQSHAKLAYDFMLFYANELNRSESKVKSISQMTVRERVIDTLLYLNRKFGSNKGYLDVPLSRREYAEYAGTTEEQVIRMFSALKKEQLIVTKGKKIGIPDVMLLKKEISEHHFYLDS